MIFDGGMGSELVKAGVSYNVPEDLNITHPEVIKGIHQSYADAGSDFITTNTFGLNRIKYKGQYDIAFVAEKAIENARSTNKKVFFDIGPTGALLKPLGTLSFDDAYQAYKEVVIASSEKVDGYIVETFSDLYELKTAVLAIKENSDKPIFATMTFDKSGRTLTGTTPEIMVAFLEGCGVNALGVNCSLGPDELYPVIKRIIDCASVPVIIQPNRGLPKFENGRSYYDLTVEEFTESVKKYTEMGVSIIGGCCVTDPDFISSISAFKGRAVIKNNVPIKNVIASYSKCVDLDDGIEISDCTVDDAIEDGEYDDLAFECMDLVDDGADAVKVIVTADDCETASKLIAKIQEYSNVPIIVSASADACEKAARCYNGILGVYTEICGLEAAKSIQQKYGATIINN